MATDIYHLRDWRWGIIEGNTGTASGGGSTDFDDTTLASTASTQIPTDNTIEITKNVNKRRPSRANGYRQNWHIDATQDDAGVSPTLSWSGPATLLGLANIFAGLFQRCDEGATTPFEKIFKWPTNTAVWSTTTFGYPTFGDDDGYFFGFVGEAPTSGIHDIGILSCVPESVTFSIDGTPENNRLSFTSNWMGRLYQHTIGYTSPTAYAAPNYFVFDNMTVSLDGGTSVTCYGWSLTINPGFKAIPAAGAGTDDYSMGPHLASGYIDILWDASTRAVFADLGDAGSSQTVRLDISWGSGAYPVTTTGDLLFRINAMFDGHQNQGSEERIIRLSFEGVKDATYEDIEIQLADAVDRSWQS